LPKSQPELQAKVVTVVVGVLVGEEGFDMGWKGGISISAEMGLDIRIHRS